MEPAKKPKSRVDLFREAYQAGRVQTQRSDPYPIQRSEWAAALRWAADNCPDSQALREAADLIKAGQLAPWAEAK